MAYRDAPMRSDEPVDAALRMPHPAVLVAGSLTFVAIFSLVTAVQQLNASEDTDGGAVITLALAVVCGICAAALFVVRRGRKRSRSRTMPAALIGLVLLDAAPIIAQVTAFDPAGARSRVALLILPTVIAASSLAAPVFRSQVVIATGLATIMLALVPAGVRIFSRSVETLLVIAVLVGGALLVRQVSSKTAKHISELRNLALTDKLTGVLNRRGLADSVASANTVGRRSASIGVLSIDIDHFKWFNDEYGHAAGDEVLRQVCSALQEAAGVGSLVARTGGEELVALVPGPAEPAAVVFRELLAQSDSPRVTVSIGILDISGADLARAGGACADPLWQILDSADHAMYRAKTTGRDRICRGELDTSRRIAPPLAPPPEHAAVPAAEIKNAAAPSPLPGWVLTTFSVLGLVTGFVRSVDGRSTGLVELYLAVVLACLIAGIFLIAMGPLMDRFRWFGGIAGTDLVLIIASLSLGDGASRTVALLPLLLTGLMVAQHFGRRLLGAHHVVVMVACLSAPTADPTPSMFLVAALTAAILIGSTEQIYFLQQRQHVAATDLHRWSVTDPLTGLANRHGLELGFENLSRAEQLTVLALDVDDFKGINDTYGHAAGDDALIRLAATLREVAGPDTVVGRTGGDEFVVLAPSARPSALTSTVKRAAALLPLPLSVSAGSAVASPHRLRSLWQLVDAADAALMRAKRARRAEGSRAEDRWTADRPAADRWTADRPAEDRWTVDSRTAGRRPRPNSDQREPAGGPAGAPVIASDDGSSSDTSTRTVAPSEIEPASNSRAS